MVRAWKPVAALAAAGLLTSAAPRNEDPVVVELYQSQGCSSCPPANANLNAIAGRADVIALSFAVTYWDRLGWKDIFAHPAFTARQWEYAKAGGRDKVFTPQMIVDGRGVLVGGKKTDVDAALKKHRRTTPGPAVTTAGGRISVARATERGQANVWLIRYDPRTHQVAIRSGENGGRTLPHRNIVREVHLLGKWSGAPASFPAPPERDSALESVVLVQDGPGGAILSAKRI